MLVQKLTWCNNRENEDRIYERLDRVYSSKEWLQDHPEAISFNFPIIIFDHSPISLNTNPMPPTKKSLIKVESWCLGFSEIKELR